MLTVDALAQEIRRVDGNNSLGAGALAEALMPFLTAAPSPSPAPGVVEALDIAKRIRANAGGTRAHIIAANDAHNFLERFASLSQPANPAQGVSEKLDNLSPAESIGAFDGSGQWIEVCTVAEFRQSVSEANRVADALEACDWSGPSIGNKATLQKAVEILRSAAIGAGDEQPFHLVEEFDDVGAQMVVAPAIGAGGQAVADIVPEGCTGSALAFDPGVLHVNKDGSGYIAVDEEAWQLEDDRCEGVDGPEGSVHWITRLDAGEMQALRDFLNGAPRSHPAPSGQAVAVTWKPLDDDGLAALEINGKRITTFPSYGEAQEVSERILSALARPVQPGWRPIETAPHNQTVILGWFDWRDGQWCMEIGPASWGTRVGAASNMSGHGSAKYWLPLDVIPAAPQPKGE